MQRWLLILTPAEAVGETFCPNSVFFLCNFLVWSLDYMLESKDGATALLCLVLPCAGAILLAETLRREPPT